MNKLIVVFLFILVFVSLTNGIICVICSSQSSSACSDPFNSTSASYVQLSGYTYCQKNVFVNGLITRFGGSTCSTSDVYGITMVYCCSDRDSCNNTSKLRSSLFYDNIIYHQFYVR